MQGFQSRQVFCQGLVLGVNGRELGRFLLLHRQFLLQIFNRLQGCRVCLFGSGQNQALSLGDFGRKR